MAIPKSTNRTSIGDASAFLETASVTFASVPANSTLVVEVGGGGLNTLAPFKFNYGRKVLVELALGQADWEAGILVSEGQVVFNTQRRIRFRMSNTTASPITPAAKVLWCIAL